MNSPETPPQPNEQHPPVYSYAGGYGGYEADAFQGTGAHRTFNDYALILRERLWYIIIVSVLVFGGALAYTLGQTKLYSSTASIQIFRRDPIIMQVQGVVDNEVRSAEDLNTQIKVLESTGMVERVAGRLTVDQLREFLAPYESKTGSKTVNAILLANRKVTPFRQSLVLAIQYTHPNQELAAKIANWFVDEYISNNSHMRIDESMKAVDDLKIRADQQKVKVEELGRSLQAYREKNSLISLDERKDIATEKLKALNLYVAQSSAKLSDADVRWQQVKERKANIADLVTLSFIASQPNITALNQQVSDAQIAVAKMRERYRAKHPKMSEAMNQLAQTQNQLTQALANAASTIESEYQTALRNDLEARAALAKQEDDSLKLDRFAVGYKNLERDYEINEKLLQSIISRMRETSLTSTIETQNARIVDRAQPSTRPASPNVALNLMLGVVGGLGLGIGAAFFAAFVDDRVKSAFDIESVVGLPLIGIIPEIEKMEQPERAQIALTQADPRVAESILAIQASLRVKDREKKAKVLLVSSTIPGEGKSFTASNLALTFAGHGERTVIVDCDLRKPNVHNSFELKNMTGVAEYCAGTNTLDEVIIKNVHPNFDIVTAGRRTKNPTQILNSKGFETLISELRLRYDRIFLDTPPLAAVSDALLVLPLADGFLFTIYFNRVRRKAAKLAAARMRETNIPCYGAVLNGLNLAIAEYYYAQYYSKEYSKYYTSNKDQD